MFLSWHAKKTVRNMDIQTRWLQDERHCMWWVREAEDGTDELCVLDLEGSPAASPSVLDRAAIAAALGSAAAGWALGMLRERQRETHSLSSRASVQARLQS